MNNQVSCLRGKGRWINASHVYEGKVGGQLRLMFTNGRYVQNCKPCVRRKARRTIVSLVSEGRVGGQS